MLPSLEVVSHLRSAVVRDARTESIQLNLKWSAVSVREQVFRASLEGLWTRNNEPEGIRQPTDPRTAELPEETMVALLLCLILALDPRK